VKARSLLLKDLLVRVGVLAGLDAERHGQQLKVLARAKARVQQSCLADLLHHLERGRLAALLALNRLLEDLAVVELAHVLAPRGVLRGLEGRDPALALAEGLGVRHAADAPPLRGPAGELGAALPRPLVHPAHAQLVVVLFQNLGAVQPPEVVAHILAAQVVEELLAAGVQRGELAHIVHRAVDHYPRIARAVVLGHVGQRQQRRTRHRARSRADPVSLL
jgi:hypothetical protein